MSLQTRTCSICRIGVSVRVAASEEGEAWRCLNCDAFETIGPNDERSTLSSAPASPAEEAPAAPGGEPASPPPFETSPTTEPTP